MDSRLNHENTESLPNALPTGTIVPRSKNSKAEKGKPRTGAKANKEAMEELKRKLDQCVMRDEIE